MTEQRAMPSEDGRVRLPIWLQCFIAIIGVALLAGPVVAVVWYR